MITYNKEAVEKAIKLSKDISKKQAELIHALLKKHQNK